MNTISLQLLTPNQEIATLDAFSVELPTQVGRIGILPHHESMVGLLSPGVVYIKSEGREDRFIVTSGFFEIKPTNAIVICTDDVDIFSEHSKDDIEAAKKRAQDAMNEARKNNDVEFAHHEQMLERELTKLAVVEKYVGHVSRIKNRG